MQNRPWLKGSAERFIQRAFDVDRALDLRPQATNEELVRHLQRIGAAGDSSQIHAVIQYVRNYRQGNRGFTPVNRRAK